MNAISRHTEIEMRRRDFITVLVSAAAWPVAAGAQQTVGAPVVGFLSPGSPEPVAHLVAAFRKGLSEMGYLEGRNVVIEFRWTDVEQANLPELAADLVRRRVSIIAAPSSARAAIAAKALTTTIPIVFGTQADPVESGLVSSLNRPGGNVTGVGGLGIEVGGKELGLLHTLLPRARRFALLVNPDDPLLANAMTTQVEVAASTIGARVDVLAAGKNADIDAAFVSIIRKQADGLLVAPSLFFQSRRVHITTLAARHAVPTMFSFREDAEAGGLMSYGTNISDQYRLVGAYTGRILKGEKAAELPVMQAVKFEFIINLQTAKTLGLTIPPDLLAIADGVIE